MILLKLLLFLCIGCEELKSEVINDFTNCQNFFYKGIAPVIDYESDPTDICQKFGDNYYYATKYLKEWRIPLFSAYKLECFECVNSPQPKRRDTWFVEPQVSQFALHAFRKLSYRESPIKPPGAYLIFSLSKVGGGLIEREGGALFQIIKINRN